MYTPPNTKTISIYLFLMVMIISGCLQPRSIAGQMPASAGIDTESETPAMPAPIAQNSVPAGSIARSGEPAAWPATSKTASPTGADCAAVTAIQSLHLRAAPSEKSTVVGYLLHDQSVAVTGKHGVWWSVEIGEIKGYAHSRYLKPIDPAEAGKSCQ